VVGLCAFGVIYSVTITTVPFYWVREVRELVTWENAKQRLQEGPDGDILKYHNAEVWMNPYTLQALISKREVTTTPPKGDHMDGSVSAWATLVKQVPALRLVLNARNTIISEGENILDDLYWELGMILALIMKEFPLILPTMINITLDIENHSEPKTAKYYDIYDIGLSDYFPAISTEISYPMSTYIAAVDSNISLLKGLRKEDKHKALSGFISLRFTAAISANLSMSYSAHPSQSTGRVYLEIFGLFAFYNSIQGYDDVLNPMSEQSISKFQGRLHWGQYFTPPFTAIQYKEHDPEYYASIAAFKKISAKFDPGRMMSNAFLDRVIYGVV